MNHMFSIDKLKSKCRDLYLVVNKIVTQIYILNTHKAKDSDKTILHHEFK
jgi:hypothetical protein